MNYQQLTDAELEALRQETLSTFFDRGTEMCFFMPLGFTDWFFKATETDFDRLNKKLDDIEDEMKRRHIP